MGMKQNWELFVETTKRKSKSHMNAARDWDRLNLTLTLTLIFLGAVTTFLALLPSIPSLVVAGLAGLGTMLSTVFGFLRPGDRRQVQEEASKEFKALMMKMVRCETEQAYEDLWKDLNKAILDEPFLPKKHVRNVDMAWSITPELLIIMNQKDDEVKDALDGSSEEDTRKPGNGEIHGKYERDTVLDVEIVQKDKNLKSGMPNNNFEMGEKTHLLKN